MVFGNNLGRQTEVVKQAIVQYLWNERLEAGERMPSQAELCRMFQVGAATVTRAVQALEKEGVLEVRRRVGIFVRTPRPAGHMASSVGIIGQMQDRVHSFNWLCSKYLQIYLRRNGCSCTEFPFEGSRMTDAEIMDFPGLQESLQQGLLQGIITLHNVSDATLGQLEAAGIPVCFLGSSSNSACGTVIDLLSLVDDGLQTLHEAGCRRPAVVIGALFQESKRQLEALLRHYRPQQPAAGILEDAKLEGGCNLARQLLAMPAAQRPDGLMVCDDFIAQHFFAELVRLQDVALEYWPLCVNVCNLQASLDFPCRELARYEVDIQEMAELVGSLMMRRLKDFEDGRMQLYRYLPGKSLKKYR